MAAPGLGNRFGETVIVFGVVLLKLFGTPRPTKISRMVITIPNLDFWVDAV